jgi:hypothetical protein
MVPLRQHARRRTAAAAAVVLVVAVGGCTSHGDAGTHAAASSRSAAQGGGAASSPGASGATGAPGAAAQGATSAPTTAATPGDSEIVPTQTPTPFRLPRPTPAPTVAPLISGALPATASARGSLVAGFPTQAVPLPKGLTIVSSSVASQGSHLQVGLQASSSSDPSAVNQQLATSLAKVGFAAAATAAPAGKTATQFSHGTDGVVVTYSPRLGGGTELTLAGTFTTAG